MLKSLFALATFATAVFAAPSSEPLEKRAPAANSQFNHNPVFYPPQDYPLWRSVYARAHQPSDGSLIMSWENYPDYEPDWFPIFRSTDGGATWANYSMVKDTQNGWGMRFQPNFYTLPQAIGSFAKGTLLVAGVSTPVSLSGGVWIDLYASQDSGKTWSFVSHSIYGNGPEDITTGHAAIWEPFMMVNNNKLLLFYSDQRDSAHSQKISMASTTDLKNWSVSQDVVAYSDAHARPGMPTIAYVPSTGKYVLTYEYCNDQGGGCPVHYRTASDPTQFNSATAVSSDSQINAGGTVPSSSPYIIYYKAPGASSGTLIVSSNSHAQLFINNDSADPSGWKEIDPNQYGGYSRHLLVFNDGNSGQQLHYATAGYLGCSGSCYNYVANGVGPIPSYS